MIPIKGYGGKYFADESGRVWSSGSNKIPNGGFLKPWLIGNGYESIMLYQDKKPSKFLVHRIIAQSFIPNPNNLPEVNHKDGDRLNNRSSNLEWVSSKQNKQHAIALGLYKRLGQNPVRGARHPKAKFKEDDIILIRHMAECGDSYASIGRLFDTTGENISSIVRRKTWTHV